MVCKKIANIEKREHYLSGEESSLKKPAILIGPKESIFSRIESESDSPIRSRL